MGLIEVQANWPEHPRLLKKIRGKDGKRRLCLLYEYTRGHFEVEIVYL